MTDLRNTLLQQYEAQILEMTTRHEEAMAKAQQEFESLVETVKSEAKEAAGPLVLCEPRHDKMCLREFPTRPDTNRPAQPQKLARVLKFRL